MKTKLKNKAAPNEQTPISIPHVVETKASLSLITKTNNGFATRSFEINYPEIDPSLNYNDDFLPVNEKIISHLTNKKKGIILLHGTYGTGKTTYVRYLINTLNKKRILYVSPDMVHILADPGFIDFMGSHTNSILLIEDAETILKKRNSGDNQSISNLLNLSDGLLGDCFNIQIICTFNTKLSDIDPALQRKGRLICEYEFKTLTPDKTKALAKHLGIEYQTEGTLADIYNSTEQTFVAEKQKIGFKK